MLTDFDNDIVVPFLEQVDEEQGADILIKLPREMAADLFRLMKPETSIRLVNTIPQDDAADILAVLSDDEGTKLLEKVHPENEKVIRDLMHYKQGTVGSVMNTHYIAVREGTNVGDTLKAMKDAPAQIQNRAYVYVVDDKGRPLRLALRYLPSTIYHLPSTTHPSLIFHRVLPITLLLQTTKVDINQLRQDSCEQGSSGHPAT
ncbi:MAG: hypothetical protein LAT80_14680 [Balneolaceae bacterium]|nr:hypothetical protein [Balneolaceae bacterium]